MDKLSGQRMKALDVQQKVTVADPERAPLDAWRSSSCHANPSPTGG
jgi:hypothetical protein